jgi:hypothetical protein
LEVEVKVEAEAEAEVERIRGSKKLKLNFIPFVH